jgi:nitrile hydratase subunit beta
MDKAPAPAPATRAAFSPGDRVRVHLDDPRHHTRAPRYVRGHVGQVIEVHGEHPLPDRVVASRGTEQVVLSVYAVRFPASELWGEGDHSVTVDLWDAYLEPETAAP